MSDYCQDRDLLGIEPNVFTAASFASQQLAAGDDGVISGTTFSSPGADLVSAGVAAGMVLTTYSTTAPEGRSCEIVSVDSPTTMTVSALRTDVAGDPVAPPAGSSLSYHVRTFGPQIRSVSATLSEKLRQLAEVAGLSTADFADSAQLRWTAAHGVLASIFLARADGAADDDAHWVKARYYRRLFGQLQVQLRLAVDADGDGIAEQTRTLGNVALKRT